MFSEKTIGVVVPAYNEEALIGKVIETMPEFVDTIIVVNDASKDKTGEILADYAAKDSRVKVVTHEVNRGLGQSLIDGYLEARKLKIDAVAVMAGDAQMSPDDLPRVIGPVVKGKADYVKGNRLLRHDVVERMPRHRFIGNSVLTLLTKFATGYWHIIDPQCGYTAISKRALAVIPIEKMIKGYGYNAHILNMLNLNNYKVRDVEVEPVYGEEQSKIKLSSYIPRVSWLLVKLFLKRLKHKYLVREFHPLIFFYIYSVFSLVLVSLPYTFRFFYLWSAEGSIHTTTLIFLVNIFSIGLFSLFLGMWMDMEDNKKLIGKN